MEPSPSFDRASRHQTHHLERRSGPPIDLIVIGGNTPDPQRISGSRGFFTSPSPRRPLVGVTTQEYVDSTSNATPGTWPSARLGKLSERRSQLPSSGSFKLQPRNPLTSGSSSSRVSTRGRKRRAHSISVPRRGIGCSEDDVEKSIVCSDAGEENSRNNELTLSPILTMRTLTLQSPTARQPRSSPLSISSSGLPYPRTYGSSCFSAYAGSPVVSSANNVCASASLASGISSNQSSPRQIPLAILSEGRSPHKTPRSSRARLVGHGASLLYSLDKESPLSDVDARTPKLSSSAPAMSFSWPKNETSGAVVGANNTKQSSTPSIASPRTPLPKKLHLTPRTPSSGGNNEGRSHLPMFPSSIEGDIVDCTFAPNRNTVATLNDKMDREMDDLLQAFSKKAKNEKSKAPAISQERLAAASGDVKMPSRAATEADLKSHPSPEARALEKTVGQDRGCCVIPTHCGLRALHSQTPPPATTGCIKIKSILTTSRASGGMLAQMMEAEARAGVLDAETGSLSDSDDEEFILAAPTGQPFERHIQGSSREAGASTEDGPVFVQRARQRRRCGDKQPNEHSAVSNEIGSSRTHSSMTSLAAASTCTSSTSLFGMDIVQEGTSARTTPFSHMSSSKYSAKSVRDSSTPEYEISSSSHHSQQSSHSLGLCVDDVTENPNNKHEQGDGSGRDLVTPPITLSAMLATPPSLPNRFTQGTSTACADRSKVSLAIASMEARENRGSV